MRPITLATALLLSPGAATYLPPSKQGRHELGRRDNTEACTDLRVTDNNGNRKVAVVLDSSGSMDDNDPDNLRITAGQALNAFLISGAEAGGGKVADQIAVIDFDDSALLLYPLGDPGNANSSFGRIDSSGGTNIASGVTLAIDELSRTPDTDKRSALVVFTDGEVRPRYESLTLDELRLTLHWSRTPARMSSSPRSPGPIAWGSGSPSASSTPPPATRTATSSRRCTRRAVSTRP
jgi:Mg-chelatase subunit ChlD